MRVIAGRYEERESLGSGGMAHVLRARDRVLDRDVALKLLRSDIGTDPTLRERFLRESRLAGSLNHRHVVRVYDAGIDDGTPWMAMELVEGASLRHRMDAVGPYPLAEAAPIMLEVLSALEAAHAADVIHRDIKPANILLGPDGAKLGDFGIAKSIGTAGANLTQFNQFLGTPKYTPPEVATGNPATKRSDLYAAAVVFWEMLAGRPPYEHENPLTLAMMHRTDPLPSLAEIRPDLPRGVVEVLESALAKEPRDRPADAGTLAERLSAAADGRPSVATTATQVLSPLAGAVAAGRQQTIRVPVQSRTSPPAAASGPAPAPSGTGQGGTRPWGLALLVAGLIVAAVVAFTLAGAQDDATGPDPSATAVPPGSQAPTGTPTSDVPADPTVAPAPAPAPEPSTLPPPAPIVPTPDADPTTTAPATAEPTTPPAGTPTPAEPPTSSPEPLLIPPILGGGDPSEQSTTAP